MPDDASTTWRTDTGAGPRAAPGLLGKLTGEGRRGPKTRVGIYDYTPDEARRVRDERDLRLWSALRSRAARQDAKEEAP